jgi:hypothetical protein
LPPDVSKRTCATYPVTGLKLSFGTVALKGGWPVHAKTHRATQALACAALFALSALAPLADEAPPLPVRAGPRMSMASAPARPIASRCVASDGRTTYVDPDVPCTSQAARYDVFALADITLGAPLPQSAYRARGDRPADEPNERQCVALQDLVRTIDTEVLRPGPAPRRDQLREIRQLAMAEQERLLC